MNLIKSYFIQLGVVTFPQPKTLHIFAEDVECYYKVNKIEDGVLPQNLDMISCQFSKFLPNWNIRFQLLYITVSNKSKYL